MAKKTGKPKLGDVESILEWAEEAISLKRDARVAADEAVAYAEQALGFRPRERNAILLTKEARLALIECESHASRAKDRRWAVESLAPPHRREGAEEVVESVGRAAREAREHARRAREAVTRARRRR